MDDLEKLFKDCEKEAKTYTCLKDLQNWVNKQAKKLWEPFQNRIQQFYDAGRVPTAEDRDKIAKETGCADKQRILQEIYESMVEKLMDKMAERLMNPESEDFKEIIEKYDAAWKKLAKI